MMFSDISKFHKYSELSWDGILKSFKRSENLLQPLFEAFTNSLEAITMRRDKNVSFSPKIDIFLNYNCNLESKSADLYSIEILDNGIGLDDANYRRMVTFKDETKGFNNRGSGRLQLVHSFQLAKYESIFDTDDGKFSREIYLSKMRSFLSHNTILYEECQPHKVEQEAEIGTKLTLLTPDEKVSSYYNGLDLESLKTELCDHYLLYFCGLGDKLPQITLYYMVGQKVEDKITITTSDVPEPIGEKVSMSVPFSKISDDMKRVEYVNDKDVNIQMSSYKIQAEKMSQNAIKLTCKNEIIDSVKIKLTCLSPDAEISGQRFLFLLSSDYFDDLSGDQRDSLELIDRTEFKKRAKAVGKIDEQVLIDDVQQVSNRKVEEIHPEISEKKAEFAQQLQELKEKYLLSDEALSRVDNGDTVDEILKKAYTYDAKVMAQQTSTYENAVTNLETLDPSSEDYEASLSTIVNELVKGIPVVNRTVLSKYVARRNMVLALMSKILDRNTAVQKEGQRNEDEKLLHDLIFQQNGDSPLDSDLWLINEEYMYYKGCSNVQLKDVVIDGKLLFRSDFSEAEEEYLHSGGHNRTMNKPDILLFPSEGKCVIIEFKNPKVEVSEHLTQINNYATLIRNYSTDDFKIQTFYGYLIGQNINYRDIRSNIGDFKYSPDMKYLFRPAATVAGEDGRTDGNLYTEIISYSNLRDRAEIRNKAFTSRLFLNYTGQGNDSLDENDVDEEV